MNDNGSTTLTHTDLTDLTDLTDDPDIDLASGRWEPCPTFSSEVADSQVCGDCGWLDDDHHEPAVVRQLPVRVRPAAQPRRLAS
jgi:hypothetical protein